jgi:plasmid maintenance system antidote protein VapI
MKSAVEKKPIRLKPAWLLSQEFDTTAQFWLNGPMIHELAVAKTKHNLREVSPIKACA